MKVVKGIVVVAVALSIAGGAFASSVAAKVWNAEADGIDDPALHVGVSASLSLGGNLWLSGQYLAGTFEDVFIMGNDFDTVDGEIVFGYTANIVDVGLGARYSEWTFGNNSDEFQIFGPMIYVGVGNTFGDSPVGWYIGGSYMVKDFGDASDDGDYDAPEFSGLDTYEHYNIEGGLFLVMDWLTATCGYRIKDYVNYDESVFKGIAGTVGIGF